MAATSDPKGFKQDMLVSIRYRNELPPPPMPPKLLDIDNGGLSQYLTTSFASVMARREPPNIEVDAEGGMPIDMIGIPGYFLGDESAIMAPDILPVLDPADLALMLTPDQLKNQGSKTDNVSFLRRTQYMTSQNARANDPLTRTNPRTSRSINNKSASISEAQFSRDDTENIKRHVQKGFDIAYPESTPFNPPGAKAQPSTAAERDAWRNPTHPDNARLKPVAYYPILPDLGALTDVGAYCSIKFDKPPLPPLQGRRDDRVDVAILNAIENEAMMPAWLAKKEAFEKNPDMYEDPGPEPVNWFYHIPKLQDGKPKVRKIFNNTHPEKDSPDLWEDVSISKDGEPHVDFIKARMYPVSSQQAVDSNRFLALSLFDPDTAAEGSRLKSQGRAAYLYPIYERMRLKTDRGKLGQSSRAAEKRDEANSIAGAMIRFREPTATETRSRYHFRGQHDSEFAEEFARIVKEEEEYEAAKDADPSAAEQDEVEDVSMREGGEAARVAANGVGHREVDRGGDDDADAMDDD